MNAGLTALFGSHYDWVDFGHLELEWLHIIIYFARLLSIVDKGMIAVVFFTAILLLFTVFLLFYDSSRLSWKTVGLEDCTH